MKKEKMRTVEGAINEATKYAYPIMDNICKKLDIPFPEIKWYTKLRVGLDGKEVVGSLNEDNTISLNANKVKEIIGYEDVVDRIMFAYFHEFKHYIDSVESNITIKQFVANRKKYEELANRYARTLLGWEK